MHAPEAASACVSFCQPHHSLQCAGTYAGQFVMGGFLGMRAAAWLRALVTRTVALVPAILVATLSSGALPHLRPNRIKSKQSSWNTIK